MKTLEATNKVIQEIKTLVESLEKEKKRAYSEAGDWDGGTTGGQPHPSVYVLWANKDDETPVYVGETVNLGNRLWQHNLPTNMWTKPWQYVQYVSDPKLDNDEFRLLLESFLVYVLNPSDNNPKRKDKRADQ